MEIIRIPVKSAKERLHEVYVDAQEIVGRVFPDVVIGVGPGEAIHGGSTEDFIGNTLRGGLAVPARSWGPYYHDLLA
ncbi:hypothetical protein KGY64_05715 [Candidatus Bipolaricaulota bacterium]|nr:hypothetical protein [Candidatus Bipolaricaulota bacterium]